MRARRGALKGYRDGTMTETELATAMQDMMAAEADKKFAQPTHTTSRIFGNAVKTVAAHLTEAPTNWCGAACILPLCSFTSLCVRACTLRAGL